MSPAAVRTALVPGRDVAHRLESLGIARDARRQVRPLAAVDAYTRWVTGRAVFCGEAVLLAADGGRRLDTTVDDTGTFAVGEGRIVGIVDPDDADQPSLWLSWDLDAVTTAPDGAAGSRRPRALRLRGPGVDLVLVGVAQVVGEAFEPGREAHFLDALGHLSV